MLSEPHIASIMYLQRQHRLLQKLLLELSTCDTNQYPEHRKEPFTSTSSRAFSPWGDITHEKFHLFGGVSRIKWENMNLCINGGEHDLTTKPITAVPKL